MLPTFNLKQVAVLSSNQIAIDMGPFFSGSHLPPDRSGSEAGCVACEGSGGGAFVTKGKPRNIAVSVRTRLTETAWEQRE